MVREFRASAKRNVYWKFGYIRQISACWPLHVHVPPRGLDALLGNMLLSSGWWGEISRTAGGGSSCFSVFYIASGVVAA